MKTKNPIATILMEGGGRIVVELLPEYAPNTVENFIELAKEGFYDGLIFHRVIANFMIQGGCPEGSGMGGPKHRIKGEFSENGIKNSLKHARGVISMARSMNHDSAGSQFFIMHQDSSHLDGKYAAFGIVIEGMEVVDQIATTSTNHMDRPIQEQKIQSITVELFDYAHKGAEKIEE